MIAIETPDAMKCLMPPRLRGPLPSEVKRSTTPPASPAVMTTKMITHPQHHQQGCINEADNEDFAHDDDEDDVALLFM